MSDRPDEPTFSVGAVTRLTGLSPDVLRAWERRYKVVTPLRTEGGTRRYTERDVAHLRRVKAAVDAGHRIGEVARLDGDALERRVAVSSEAPGDPVQAALDALDRLDGAEAERLASLQLSALGPARFARQFALPLMQAVGDGWASERLCVASEHLGSALVRSLLGTALRQSTSRRGDPLVVFGTPQGERHEIGLLIAALTAVAAGANPLYLGPDLPSDELTRAVSTSEADALALSLIAVSADEARRSLRQIAKDLRADVELWVGGSGAAELELPARAQRIDDLAHLEQRVELLRERMAAR